MSVNCVSVSLLVGECLSTVSALVYLSVSVNCVMLNLLVGHVCQLCQAKMKWNIVKKLQKEPPKCSQPEGNLSYVVKEFNFTKLAYFSIKAHLHERFLSS